jgi:hypothetical protein
MTQLCTRDGVEMITYMSSGWPAPFASTQFGKLDIGRPLLPPPELITVVNFEESQLKS